MQPVECSPANLYEKSELAGGERMKLFLIMIGAVNLLLLAVAVGLLLMVKSQTERLARLDEQSKKLVEEMERHTVEAAETDMDGDSGA